VTKPFSPRELVARVQAVLRRSRGPRLVRVNDVEINLDLRTVTRAGRPVNVTATEFRLLEVLASVPGRSFSRSELADRVFRYDRDAQERTLDAHVMHLRRKVEPLPGRSTVIVTVFGVGYRLGRDDD
jgi:DNA-binding response OmpR family regulator